MNKKFWIGSGLFAAVALVGCGGGDSASSVAPAPAPPSGVGGGNPAAALRDVRIPSAGVPIDPISQSALADYREFASRVSGGRRSDPFSLLGPEARFEREEQRDRLLQDLGGFDTMFEEPEETVQPPAALEPQPYRRLVGILLGDGVSALIQMEDGRVYDVRPGSRVGNSPWTVVAIDNEKAILRREGDTRPNIIEVRLEPDIRGGGGGAPAAGGGTPAGGGAAGQPGAGEMAPGGV